MRYEFSNSDWGSGKEVLRMFIEEQEQLPWEALIFVTGQITYGGRVTDEQDRNVCLVVSMACPLFAAATEKFCCGAGLRHIFHTFHC